MSKKSLISSIVIGAILTLSLGIYTLVSAIVALTTPHHNTVAIAYTSDQQITAFRGYSEDNSTLSIEYDGEKFLLYDATEDAYVVDPDFGVDDAAGAEYKCTATVVTDKHGSTTTYNVTVYRQGSGSADSAYIVANKDNLTEIVNLSQSSSDLAAQPGFIATLVEDVDLAGVDWQGIGSAKVPFAGTFIGNGHTIKNMTIDINATNYEDRIETISYNDYENDRCLAVGLFNAATGAKISGVSLENAYINIDSSLYKQFLTGENSLYYIRAGLLVGSARNVTINGSVENVSVDDANEEVTTIANAKITGKISGFSVGEVDGGSTTISGIGGIVGTLADQSNGGNSTIQDYDVVVDIANKASYQAETSNYNYVGGVAGNVLGLAASEDKTTISNVNATLTGSTYYRNSSRVGAIAGYANNVALEDITTKIDMKENNVTVKEFIHWIAQAENSTVSGNISYVSGVVAQLVNSDAKNINVNSYVIDVYGYSAGAFSHVENSKLTNVSTNGRLIGYNAAGVANTLKNSTVEYVEQDENSVVVSGALSGWRAAGYANMVEDSNISGNNDISGNNVNVKVSISARGYTDFVSNEITNIAYSAGLVGYFYCTDDNMGSIYTISGVNVDVSISQGVDMAGLVCYIGNDDLTKTNLVVKNCSVVANLNSYASLTESTTHKVAGAVDTIYGGVKLDNIDVTVKFNQNHSSAYNYGAAMFGGLVARVAGEYVTISDCTVQGSAYINSSAYTKTYSGQTYTQITAGGLVGSIASFSSDNLAAGAHYVDANGKTVDHVDLIDTTNIAITGNTVDVNIVIDYKEDSVMGTDGYRARSVGSLVGLIMNGIYDSDNNITIKTIDLTDNNTTYNGNVTANETTFTYARNVGEGVSYLQSNNDVVGSSYSFTATGSKSDTKYTASKDKPVEDNTTETPDIVDDTESQEVAA